MLDAFKDFWQKFFPEQNTMTREQALLAVDEERAGDKSALPDSEMVPYQNAVAEIYGAYEGSRFAYATMEHILTWVRFPREHLVSLGSGPSAYELFLLEQGLVKSLTLIDQSDKMLERARGIAKELGIEAATFIHSDVKETQCRPKSADLLFCLNAMHWSKEWRRWIRECGRILKNNRQVVITCTLKKPRSNIEPQELGAEIRKFFTVEHHNLLIPPQLIRGTELAEVSLRYIVIGRKKI